MRATRAARILACLGILAAAPAPAADEVPSWYAQAVAYSEGGWNVTYFWSKGPKLRAETVIGGHPVVTIVNGPVYYAYDKMRQEGIAIRRAPEALARDAEGRRPFGREFEILTEQGAEKVREEEHRFVQCDVYRVTDKFGKRELWVTQDVYRLPMRLEIYTRKDGQTRNTDYLNWVGGVPVTDGFFEPESGIELKSYAFDDYLRITIHEGPIGPVPVLYADLLHGGRNAPEAETGESP